MSDKDVAMVITMAKCVNLDITDARKVREIYKAALEAARDSTELLFSVDKPRAKK